MGHPNHNLLDTGNPGFKEALNLVQFTTLPVFLTGRAGTGKSTFLKYLRENTLKKHVVLAPTGIAAINVGGVTIHSFFKIPLRPILPDDPELTVKERRIFNFLKYTKAKIKLIREVELIIIDEISMVRCDTLDFIDQVLRVYSGNSSTPFGGKQLLLVGDAFQLEPVVKRDEWQILSKFYKSPHFFSARAFKQLPLAQVDLQKVYRQHDPTFVNILDKIRLKKAGPADLEFINRRLNPSFEAPKGELFITLATRRDIVDWTNEQKLNLLNGKEHVFEGEISGEFPGSSLPTSQRLVMKKNAQVMFVRNDPERRWYNGTLGVVEDICPDSITVRVQDGGSYLVKRDKWENLTYKFDEHENRVITEEIGSFVQFPLRLAWAVTVHKSQGLTFDKVLIDFTGGAFACGQLYVALSRCRTLNGLVLKTPVSQADIKVDPGVADFALAANNREIIEEGMRDARARAEYKNALESFRKHDWLAAVKSLAIAVDNKNELSKPVVQRFVSRQFVIVGRANTRVKELEKQLEVIRATVTDFAREYFLMANECQVKYNDSRSAIANLNKAIKLNPSFIEALFRRANLLAETGDYIGAENDCNEILKLNPRHLKALKYRGVIRFNHGNAEGAYKDLLAAVQLDNTNPEIYRTLSLISAKLGEEEDSKRYRKIAQQLEKRK